jgi:phage repressor protein C with HTH and peptisase S24 domain
MIKLIKVTGQSLSPFFLPGDYVVISRSRLLTGKIKEGDMIVFQHPEHGRMIKKVTSVEKPKGLFVSGTHPESLDSSTFGPIPSHWVTGKVLWHISRSRPPA